MSRRNRLFGYRENSRMNIFSVRFFLFVVLFSVFSEAAGADRRITFANPASNQTQQSFLRVVNTSSATGLVTLSGIDDAGNSAPGGDLTFTLGPNEAKQFNSLDYENGNEVTVVVLTSFLASAASSSSVRGLAGRPYLTLSLTI